MNCIAGGLQTRLLQLAACAGQRLAAHWQQMYVIVLVSIVVSALVGVQLRMLGHVTVETQAWFTGAGIYGVLGMYKDALDLKFPYFLLLMPAEGMGWLGKWLMQQYSQKSEHFATAMVLGTLLGGVVMLAIMVALHPRAHGHPRANLIPQRLSIPCTV